jgi:hypothetical protein
MGLGHANVCTEFDAKMAAKSWRCGAMANQRLLLEGSFDAWRLQQREESEKGANH